MAKKRSDDHAHEPYVDILGEDLTIEFLLHFGGTEIYIPADPKSRSRVADLIGRDKAKKLAQAFLPTRVPLANQWLAKAMYVRGVGKGEIARRLRISDVTVRKWLGDAETPQTKPDDKDGPEQLSLF